MSSPQEQAQAVAQVRAPSWIPRESGFLAFRAAAFCFDGSCEACFVPQRSTFCEASKTNAQLRQEVAQSAQRELLTKMTEKCFAKCTSSKGGTQLERSEQQCIANCIDRYVDCMNTVNEALIARQNSRT